MKARWSLVPLFGVSALLLSATDARAGAVTIINPGFEAPSVPGSYAYTPSLADQGGQGWTFSLRSGVAANGPFAVSNPVGNQAGFMQSTESTISQTLAFTESGTAQLSFLSEYRRDYIGANPFVVTLDSLVLTFAGNGVVTPTSGSTFDSYLSDPFAVAAGSHTLQFSGQGVGLSDVTSFIDQVQISVDTSAPSGSAVPEPATLISAAIGGAFLCAIARRARSARKPE